MNSKLEKNNLIPKVKVTLDYIKINCILGIFQPDTTQPVFNVYTLLSFFLLKSKDIVNYTYHSSRTNPIISQIKTGNFYIINTSRTNCIQIAQ